MKVHFDQAADALYIRFSDASISESEEVQSGIILDFDEQSRVVAIEILRVSRHMPNANLKQFEFKVA
jgi:uncharacterized protein YuzE